MNKRTKAIAKAFLLSGIGTVVTAIAAGSLSKSKSTPAKVLSVGASALAGLAIFYGESERFTSESLISLQHEMIDDLQESKEKLRKENAALEDEKWTLEMEKWDLDRENFKLKWDIDTNKEIAKLEEDDEEEVAEDEVIISSDDFKNWNPEVTKVIVVKEATEGEQKALERAKSYLECDSFSREGLIRQVVYEGFTTNQAAYAVDSLGVDWAEQAVKTAKNYFKYSSKPSEEGLINYLKQDKFTSEQISCAALETYSIEESLSNLFGEE